MIDCSRVEDTITITRPADANPICASIGDITQSHPHLSALPLANIEGCSSPQTSSPMHCAPPKTARTGKAHPQPTIGMCVLPCWCSPFRLLSHQYQYLAWSLILGKVMFTLRTESDHVPCCCGHCPAPEIGCPYCRPGFGEACCLFLTPGTRPIHKK